MIGGNEVKPVLRLKSQKSEGLLTTCVSDHSCFLYCHVSWSFSPSHDIVSNLNKTNLFCLKSIVPTLSIIRRVWRYQRDNQNRKIEELRRDNAIGKTNLYKTLNRTLIIEQPETGDELMCSGRVGMSWSKSGTCCATMFFDRTCHLFSW